MNSVEAIKQCVIVGMGITILPAFTVSAELGRGIWSGHSDALAQRQMALARMPRLFGTGASHVPWWRDAPGLIS